MIELDNIDIKLNYLSYNLIREIKYIYNILSNAMKIELNEIVKDIMIIMNRYFENKKIIQFDTKIKYNMIESTVILIERIDIISTSNTILRKMNMMDTYILYYNTSDITSKHEQNSHFNETVVSFYYNKSDNKIILEKNIHKIMIRLYNLFSLYGDKNPNIMKMKYEFYLYNNPRCADKNKYGKKYLISLKNSKMKKFNTSSGVTIFKKNKIIVSRTEDCIGLLTHEVLHACDIINVDIGIMVHGILVNFTEAYVNMFASIINAYLTFYEMIRHSKTDNTILLNQLIMIEVIHSITHSSKLARISSYKLNTILDINNMISWYQDAFMYEYIIVKMLLLINFKDMMKNKKFASTFLSYGEVWGDNDTFNDMIKNNFKKYSLADNNMIKEIDNIYSQYLDKNNYNIMIMQYNAIDVMIMEDDYKDKYMKYKIKYLELQK